MLPLKLEPFLPDRMWLGTILAVSTFSAKDELSSPVEVLV
jgi:hypothetical protein